MTLTPKHIPNLSTQFTSTLAYNTTILWITTIVYQPSFLLAPIYFFNAVVQVMLKNRNPLFSIKQIMKGNFFNHSPQIPNTLDPALYRRSHLVTFSVTVLCHIIHWITLGIFPLRFCSYSTLCLRHSCPRSLPVTGSKSEIICWSQSAASSLIPCPLYNCFHPSCWDSFLF